MSWTALTQVEIDQLRAEQFSQAEACYITSISSERLLTWHKLNQVPEPRSTKGKGVRRKYNFYQLAYLCGLRILSSRGVPLEKAQSLIECVIVPHVKDVFEPVCGAKSIDDADRVVDVLILISSDYCPQSPQDDKTKSLEDVDYHFDILLDGKPIGRSLQRSVGPGPYDNFHQWMRGEAQTDVIVIDPAVIALQLRMQIDHVMEHRGTEQWRGELREYINGFKRRPAVPRATLRQRLAQTVANAFADGLTEGLAESIEEDGKPKAGI